MVPESVAAFERLRALGERGAGMLRRDIDEAEATRLFLDGETAFLVTTSWGAARARNAGVPFAATPVPPFEHCSQPEPLVATYGFFVAAHGRNRMLAEDLVADFLKRPEVTEAMADDLMAVVPTTRVRRLDPALNVVANECGRGRLMPAVPQIKEVWRLLGVAEAAIIAGKDVPPVAHRLEAQLRDVLTQSRVA